MSEFSQADIARDIGLSAMTISRAVKTLGRCGEPLAEDTALCLLTAAELQRYGMTWNVAVELAGKFSDEIRFLAFDPEVRRGWIVFVEQDDVRFQMAAVSRDHLTSILDARPLSLVLALHRPVAEACEALDALRACKEVA